MRGRFGLLLVSVLALNAPLASALPAGADDLPRRIGFGAQISTLSSEDRAALPSGTSGVRVGNVFPDSAALEAGIKSGDILVRIGETQVGTTAEFTAAVKSLRAGGNATVRVLREGKPVDVALPLRELKRFANSAFDTVYTNVRVADAKRRVIVTKPSAKGRYPTVLLVGGIGCYSIDNPLTDSDPYVKVLESLTAAGFATVRVEKSGVGDSEGTACNQVDFNNELGGYRAAMQALKSWDFVDADKVFIWGHSIGGVGGPLLAGEFPVKGIVVLATVGYNWFEYELENLRRQLLLNGAAHEQIDTQLALKARCMAQLLLEKVPGDELRGKRAECAPFVNYPASSSYMQQVAAVNLAEAWKKANGKVLVIYPEADFVSAGKDHEYIVDMVNRMRPGTATLARIPEMDHYFAKVKTQRESQLAVQRGQPFGSFNDEAIRVTREWLVKTLS
jgi:pimeloyl-ACP methyl ester carboxylesterase